MTLVKINSYEGFIVSIIAKLEVHDMEKISLNILFDYLNKCKQELKLALPLAIGTILLQEYHKDQFWNLYFLTFSSMTHFFSRSNQKYVILLVNTRFKHDKKLGTVISNLEYDMTNV